MSKVLIINGHHKSDFSQGRLNNTLVNLASEHLQAKGHEIITTAVEDGWDVQEQLEYHQWADVVILQSPVNWMGVSWLFKKYMDEVYTAGMGGQLCIGDGRSEGSPDKNYGAGGVLTATKYMLSLTFNAPERSFNDPDEFLFQGKSVDDLFFPMHVNFRFFGMQALPTFACFDVIKNPNVEKDFQEFLQHLDLIH